VIVAEPSEPHRQQVSELVGLRPGNLMNRRQRQPAETVPVIQRRCGKQVLGNALLIPVERRAILPGTRPVESWGLREYLQLIVIAHGEQAIHPHGGSHTQYPLVGATGLKDTPAGPSWPSGRGAGGHSDIVWQTISG
jgi:hypothetical protein